MHPHDILRDLESGALLSTEALSGADVDSLLEMRSRPEFESNWVAAYEFVDAAWNPPSRSPIELGCIKRIREIAFKRVFALTGNDDLAAMVSDDFDIISRSIALSMDVTFINSLREDYYGAKIPK